MPSPTLLLAHDKQLAHSPANQVDRLGLRGWDRDTRSLARLTGLTIVLAALLTWSKGLFYPLHDLLPPLAICGGLAAVIGFYAYLRPADNFVQCAKALLILVAFSPAFSTLMYALAPAARPLGHAWLLDLDAQLGISAPSVVRWTLARPWLALLLKVAYFSIIPQTVVVIGWLGLSHQARPLNRFLLRFLLTALVTAIGFSLLPAIGTCVWPDVPTPSHYVAIVDHLQALRGGQRTLVSWRDAEGIITFPSFHATWAVLLMAAFAGQRRLFPAAVALNLLVIASTLPIGMHYGVDAIVGTLIGVGFILLVPVRGESQAKKLARFFQSACGR